LLEASLMAPSAQAELAQAGKRLKAVMEELHALEENWLRISEELDAVR
jgi:ATP-binding cassette subfamily F protein 3